MSKNFTDKLHKFTKKADPVGHAAVEGVFEIDKQNKAEAAALNAAAADAAAADAAHQAALDEATRNKDITTRAQDRRRVRAEGGAVAGGNDADLLGYAPSARRKGQLRTVLG